MSDVYVLKYNLLSKTSGYISAFPDVRSIKQAAHDYNAIYGVNDSWYPAPYPGHIGTDWLFGTGTTLYGLDGFTVNDCGSNSARGNWVEIGNPHISFAVFHLSSINVSKGQKVDSNTVIGKTGNTGYSQGPHLHVQTWLAGAGYVDSTPYMDGTKAMPGDSVKQVEHIFPNRTFGLQISTNKLSQIVEAGRETDGTLVYRVMQGDGDISQVILAKDFKTWPMPAVGRIVSLDGELVQIIEYGNDNKGTVARIRRNGKDKGIVYGTRFGHPAELSKGSAGILDGIGEVSITDTATDSYGNKVMRITAVVYATQVKHK